MFAAIFTRCFASRTGRITLPSAIVLALILTFGVAVNSALAQGDIIYVDADATGADNGTSWADAYLHLQDALAAANSGDQIWVAAGVYHPDQGAGQIDNARESTFQLKNGVALYGGFAGTESTLAQRDWTANVTVLSGDLDGNDGTAPTGDNAYHVVTGSGTDGTARLDGFTVTAGLANGDLVDPCGPSCGGGMVNDNGDPTIANISFSGNRANDGGGLSNHQSSPALTNVSFSGNYATNDGGGMHNRDSSPALTNVYFSGNLADDDGGGIHNESSSSPNLINVSFSGNSVDSNGGGMFNNGGSPTLTNVSFSGNSANRGGGMYNFSNSSPTLTNVSFSGNSANEGGGMRNFQSSSTLTNVSFSGNSANEGGGMANRDASSLTIQNSVFWNNQDSSGIGTASASIHNVDTSSPTIRYSVVQGCNPGDTWNANCGTDDGNNLADADPLFVSSPDPSTAPTTAGDLRLQSGSLAINAGNDAYNAEEFDLNGAPRIVGAAIDLGAYEFQIVYVDADATGAATGLSWTDAFTNVQDALAVPQTSYQIWVAAGVYYPDQGAGQSNNARASTFRLKNGVALYGGFAGTESTLAQRDWEANVTVLSGDLDGNDTVDANGVVTDTANLSGANAYHVVTGSGTDGTALLDGFTVTAGWADGAFPQERGGGMVNNSGSPTLTNVSFSGNAAERDAGGMYNNDHSSPTLTNASFSGNSTNVGSGGGMYNFNSSPTLTNVSFSGNSAGVNGSASGGGMVNYSNSNPTLTNVSFSGNSASLSGGGMYNNNSSPTLTSVSFTGNSANGGGGGVVNVFSSSPTLTNVSFSGNSTNGDGGGMSNGGNSSPTLTNVSFSGNSADGAGGGMSNNFSSSPTIQNSIVWNNRDSSGTGTADASIFNTDGSSTPVIRYSLVQGCNPGGAWNDGCGTDDGNNLADADPRFVTAVDPSTAPTTLGDLLLQAGSPAIDAGDNGLIPGGVSTDLDGNDRVQQGTVDLGAYESSFAAPVAVCFATPNDGTTVYASADSLALRVAVAAVSAGGTVKIAGTCAGTVNVGGTDQLVQVTQPITLAGGYTTTNWITPSAVQTTTLDALYGGRVISATVDLTVQDLAIQNGRTTVAGSAGNGAGIHAGQSITLSGVVLYNNAAGGSNVRGGGVYVGGEAVITDTAFLSNTARSGGGIMVAGAATITAANFISNTAWAGGGIYVLGASALVQTDFIGNRATGAAGGGAYIDDAASITDATFTRNETGGSGGGLWTNNGTTVLTGTTFLSNTADYGGGAYLSDAGILTNTTFISNTATTGVGGGVAIYAEAAVSGSVFSENQAGIDGGGMYVLGGNADIVGTTFISNAADNYGGGVYVRGGGAVITDTAFLNNTVDGYGGGLSVDEAVRLLRTEFTGNTSAARGGGLYALDKATLVQTTFTDNLAVNIAARTDGGGAYISDAATILESTFSGNVASNQGGGALVLGGGVVSATTFISNTAFDGGGLLLYDPAVITGTTFLSNTAGSSGGGIGVYGQADITNTTFISNTSANPGGAIWLSNNVGEPVSLVNNLLADNRSLTNRGDAIYLERELTSQPPGELSLRHNTLANRSGEDGPAIYVVDGTVEITNTIVSNQAVAIENVDGTVSEDFNLFDNVATPISGTVTSGGNSITGTAAFVDATGGDFQLTALSDAINAGTDAGITTDFFGDVRPQQSGFDIGFDESPFAPLRSDVAITKQAYAPTAAQGEPITYTLTFTNYGPGIADGVVISDSVPDSVTGVEAQWAVDGGVTITQTSAAPNLAWTVDSLAPGVGGVITLTGTLVESDNQTIGTAFTNTATITATYDQTPENNHSSAAVDIVCRDTITVQNSDDSGPGTLRQAVAAICPNGLIDFDSALAGQTITLTTRSLVIGTSVTISASVPISISGNNSSTVINIAFVEDVTLAGLTIRDGKSEATGPGGGISNTNSRNLTLINTTVISNTAAFGGGGITVGRNSSLTLIASQVLSNTVNAGKLGGGIYSTGGAITVTNGSLVAWNQASFGSGIASAGGDVTVMDSSIVHNTAVDGGGIPIRGGGIGISGSANSGNVSITGSCIVGNSDTAVTGSANAAGNWWGNPSGPAGVGPGSGDSVGVGVDFSGFLAAAPFDCPTRPQIEISVDDVTADEDAGAAIFTVRLNTATTRDVTVDYTTADDSALDGADYTAATGTVTVTAGMTQTTVSVPLRDDSSVEGDETFTLSLSNETNADIADGEATATIRDDDIAQLAIVKTVDNATPNEGSAITYTVVVRNTGNGDATNVTVTDDMTGTLADGIALAAGEAVTYTYSLTTVDGPQTTVNTAAVTSAQTSLITDSVSVSVQNVAPTVAVDRSPLSVDEDNPITVTLGLVNDPGEDTVTGYVVDWGDGTVITYSVGVAITHVYADAGDYDIRVDVIDEDGVHIGAAQAAVTVLTTVCFATPDDGATLFASADSRAVREAVAAVSASGTVKIAGTCAGTVNAGGADQLVLVTQPITLAGGYTTTNWITPSAVQTTTLDALQSGRVIRSTEDLTVRDLTIQNGRTTVANAAGHGAGINTSQSITLSGVVLYNNAAAGSSTSGGGMFVNSSAGITSTQFISNTASNRGGGAFVNSSADITGTSFISNTAGVEGGGVVVNTSAGITNSNFISNTANWGGGAATRSTADITGASFVGNRALNDGGGLNAAGSADISNSEFIGNSANRNGGGAFVSNTAHISSTQFVSNTGRLGGGVYVRTLAGITGASFVDNRALSDGGGLNTAGNANIANSEFNGNSANRNGGAAFVNSSADIIGTQFVSNTASSGGGTYLFGMSGITNTSFISNTAGNEGGGAFLNNSAGITNTHFLSNTASWGGGVVARSSVDIRGASFVGNSSANDGGGVNAGSTTDIADTEFRSNTANRNGGGAFVNSSVAITATKFISNRSTSSGGGAYFNSSADITATQFISNTSGSAGGGLYTGNETTISNSLFSRNAATGGQGGGMRTASGLTLVNTEVRDNTATSEGGGISVSGQFVMVDSTIANNETTVRAGGGIRSTNGTINVSGSIIEGNRASSFGGGIYAFESPLTLSNTLILTNTAQVGAGIWVNRTADITGTSFISNTAANIGGGLYTGNETTISNSLFSRNAATGGQGGGMRTENGLTLVNTEVRDNTATSEGGGISVSGALQISDSLIANNRSQSVGGGVRVVNGSAAISGSSIEGNRAGNSGGGIYAGASQVTITNSSILTNTGTEGGGLWADRPVNLTRTSFIGNTATVRNGGGALLFSTAGISDTSFISNTAASSGGGAFVQSTAGITGTSFISNTSGNYGGGVALASSVSITDASFISNTATSGGGGLYTLGSISQPSQVANTLFANNRSTNDQGNALFIRGSGGSANRLTLLHSTVTNPAVLAGSAVYVNNGTVDITNTILNNQAIAIERVDGTVSEDFNLFDNVTTPFSGMVSAGTNSITGNAAFADAAGGDFQLTALSDAINAGTDAGITSDFFGDVRPQQGGFDIGFDESPFVPLYSDLAITKHAYFPIPAPGEPITYTLSFTNRRPGIAGGIVISDSVPLSVTITGVTSSTVGSGVVITQTSDAPNLAWTVSDLARGAGGVITLTGRVSGGITSLGPITNTATITAINDIVATNNSAQAVIVVSCFHAITVQNIEDSGPGSLRQAIADLCDGGVIDFDLSLSGQTITLTSAHLVINKDMTIDGSALPERVRISGNNAFRHVYLNTADINVTFNSLQFSDGNPGVDGGSIRIDRAHSVTVTNSIFTDNQTVGGNGGAIFTTGSSELVVTNSAFARNTATWEGGAIRTDGSGTVSVHSSTFVSNTALNSFGGAIARSWTGDLVVTNSTFAFNSAGNAGGAIFNRMGTLFADNNTFVENTSPNGAATNNTAGTFHLANNIMVGGGVPICLNTSGGTLVTNSNNWIADGSCSATFSGTLDLMPLSDNGGPTETFALFGYSAAVAQGDSSYCPDVDQRGAPRSLNCDLGAYEVQPGDVAITKTVTPSSAKPGDAITYTLSFTNSGPNTADGVVIRDSVPVSVSVDGVSSSGAAVNQTGTAPNLAWTVGDLPAGAGGVITLTGVLSDDVALYGSSIDNTATITATNEITPTNSNSSTATLEVLGAPVLTIAKTANSVLVDEGGAVTYTIVVANVGQSQADAVTVTDDMTGTLADGVTLAAGEVLTYTYNVTTVDGPQTTVNTAAVTSAQTSLITDSVSVNVQNVAPTVTAGTHQTVTLGSAVTVTATFGDPGSGDTHSADVDWGDSNNTNGVIDGDEVRADHTYTATGIFTVEICVEDNDSDRGCDTLTVTVTNAAPTADAGDDQWVDVNTAVSLDGSGATDADGHLPLSYGWTQTGGPAVGLSDSGAVSPTFTAPATATVLTFILTVTDSAGLAGAPDTVVITVGDVAVSGLNAANDSPTLLGQSTAFTATVGGGSNVNYTWDFGDGNSGVGAQVVHTYAAAGVFTATVTATNSQGSVSAETVVTVTNAAPIADAGDDQLVDVNTAVSLDGSGATDADGHLPLSYGWTQTGGPAVGLSDSGAVSPTFTAPATATVLTFTLTVTDSAGLVGAPDTVVITVGDVAVSGLNAANDSPTVLGQSTTFTATVGGGSNVNYTWDFGDGNTGVGAVTSHTYAAVGVYTATVTATNSQGSVSATVETIVLSGPMLTIAKTADPVLVDEGGAVTYTVVVANVGQSPATGITVTDDMTGTLADGITLAAGEVVTYTYSLTTDDGPQTTVNTAAVTSAQTSLITDSVSVQINNVAPSVLASSVVSVTVGEPLTVTAGFSDPGRADTHTATIDWGDGNGPQVAAVAGFSVSGSHPYVGSGVYTVSVCVTDNDGGTGCDVLSVTVENAAIGAGNQPVVINPGDQESKVGQAVTLAIAAQDADGDTLSFTPEGLPAGLAMNTETGVISGTPTTPGDYAVTIHVSDGVESVSISFGWRVLPAEHFNFLPGVMNAMPSYTNDFEGDAQGWSAGPVSSAPNGQKFLGEFGNETVTLTVGNLPAHTQVTVEFDLYVIRSWDGNQIEVPDDFTPYRSMQRSADAPLTIGPDQFQVRSGETILLDATFANWTQFKQDYPMPDSSAQTGAVAVNTLGYFFQEFPMDATYRVRLTFEHTAPTLVLDFTGSSLQLIEDESWGIDNVLVRVR